MACCHFLYTAEFALLIFFKGFTFIILGVDWQVLIFFLLSPVSVRYQCCVSLKYELGFHPFLCFGKLLLNSHNRTFFPENNSFLIKY